MTMSLAEVLAANSKDTLLSALDTAGVQNITLASGSAPSSDMLSTLGGSLLDAVKEGLEATQQIGIG